VLRAGRLKPVLDILIIDSLHCYQIVKNYHNQQKT